MTRKSQRRLSARYIESRSRLLSMGKMIGGKHMGKFYMNGKLIHKASDHNTKRCEVEKWVFLPHSDFERLKANPYQEHEAITAARDLMYEDKNAYHCIMLLDEYGDDGLLIEAEGFDYSRLSMFVPDAKSIYERYQTSESELKLHDMIKDTVEKIAELAHKDKTDFTSADMIDMDEVHRLALENKPKLICVGASSYPRLIDYKRFREICDEVGAYFWVDCAHDCGLIAGGAIPSPVEYAHVMSRSPFWSERYMVSSLPNSR